jgi:hypothetical protein
MQHFIAIAKLKAFKTKSKRMSTEYGVMKYREAAGANARANY